jgi:hypothetical protein
MLGLHSDNNAAGKLLASTTLSPMLFWLWSWLAALRAGTLSV